MSAQQVPSDHGTPTQPLKLYWLIRASELLVALVFVPVLPWWRPALWFALVAGTGTWLFFRVRRPDFKQLPSLARRNLYRRGVWQSAFAVGSAWWLLYEPSNHGLQSLLGLFLALTAGLVAMWGLRDIPRTAVAVGLILAPTMLRWMFDGLVNQRPMVFLLGAGGVVLGVMIVYTAILHAQRIDRESALRLRAERAANAMAKVSLDKSRFFAAVSHDLRQPVHAIGLYLEPLAEGLGPDAPRELLRAVNGIRRSWQALDELLAQVLDLTRMDVGSLRACIQVVELEPVVRSVVRQHAAMAERASVRVLALADKTPTPHVYGDEIMLRRVLSNLLDNAIKFSPAGRCVLVAVRRTPRAWRIQVRDAGPGIPEEHLDGIFQEFVQLDNPQRDRQHGYGLGLAIARRFAHLMQGDLTVRSAAGRGSCFSLTLPQAPAPRAVEPDSETPPTSEPMALEAPALPSRGILLVEDDPLVADSMCQLLAGWGQTVHCVANVEAARRASAFGELAICDVRLPDGGNGFELGLELRDLGKQVVLITGETNTALKLRAAVAGIELLTKPVSAARMRGVLQQFLLP